MEVENTPDVTEEVTQEVEAPETEEVSNDTTEEPTDSPEVEEEEPEAEETESLILGKYKSQEDLEKAYLNAQKELTKKNQALNDPSFVYEQAKKLGLAEGEVPESNVDINALVNQTVEQRLAVEKDYNEALAILPELGKDATLEAWG